MPRPTRSWAQAAASTSQPSSEQVAAGEQLVCEVPQHGGARGRLLPQLQQPEEMAAATSCSRQQLITLPAYGMLEATVLAFSC
jgi:hypothetical protein